MNFNTNRFRLTCPSIVEHAKVIIPSKTNILKPSIRRTYWFWECLIRHVAVLDLNHLLMNTFILNNKLPILVLSLLCQLLRDTNSWRMSTPTHYPCKDTPSSMWVVYGHPSYGLFTLELNWRAWTCNFLGVSCLELTSSHPKLKLLKAWPIVKLLEIEQVQCGHAQSGTLRRQWF